MPQEADAERGGPPPPSLTPERRRQIETLVHAALEREPDQRAAFAAEACEKDPELRREVESLLGYEVLGEERLGKPAWERAARLLETRESAPERLPPGTQLGPYRILQAIGGGGMGQVYRAWDEHLNRVVALKTLPSDHLADPERKQRLLREARAASALNHPNIITIYDIASDRGVDFIAMEFVEGRSLDRIIPAEGLPLGAALDYAGQIAGGLAKAHAAGIIHRDLKPSNIMVTGDGLVKLLDFGLARRVRLKEAESGTLTAEGEILGTASYMSPEQAQGKRADERSDIFSFGVTFYEMLTGRRPFQGDSALSTLMAIVRDPPPPVKDIRRDVPSAVEKLLLRCLEKDPGARYASGEKLTEAVAGCRKEAEGPAVALAAIWKRPWVAAVIALVTVAAVVVGAWSLWRYSRIQWARNEAIAEIQRLWKTENFWAAYRLAQRAQQYIPNHPVIVQATTLLDVSINTSPPGAEVYVKSYAAPEADWDLLGVTPMLDVPITLTHLRWKITKAGFDEIQGAFDMVFTPRINLPLTPAGSGPPGMVFVPKGRRGSGGSQELDDYWIDRYEVTNRQYREFVDAGGYRKREYWEHPFVREGREVAWDEAMTEFVDRTGRPGPATWRLGAYPEGQGDHPVGGVSWYEAAAYAGYAGKSLPTVHHWAKAAGWGLYSDILRFSNFGGDGPAPAGRFSGIGPFGTYDMAGNVREWCWNLAGRRRYILGGAWNELTHMFRPMDAQPPLARRETYGFRCVKYISPPAPELTGPVVGSRFPLLVRWYAGVPGLSDPVERASPAMEKAALQPVDDARFELIRGFHSYDRTDDLNAKVETVDDSLPYWTQETITFDAAYGGERVIAYLLLPKSAKPPYQVVMICPSGATDLWPSGRDWIRITWLDFIVQTGRAVMLPVWKGAFERRLPPGDRGPSERRDLLIAQAKDLSRSLDYMETREDVDPEKIAYHGYSGTSVNWPIFGAIEKRIKAAVLWVGGLDPRPSAPEVDTVNFAPRATAPTLLLNGRLDFMMPVESAQRLHNLLGTPAKHKKLFIFEGGHIPIQRDEVVKMTLDWYDRYLGPVAK